MSKFSVNSILQASNAIIVNPSKSLKDFGIDYFILSASPILFLGKKIFEYIFEYARDKQKAREEKERMYKEIIAKQQAAINRQREINRQLEILLRESQYDNDKNKEEIVNLRKQVKNLDEVINLLVQSAKQIKQEI